jgi:hypothetical protein
MPAGGSAGKSWPEPRAEDEMSGDFLEDRRRALEEAFFAKHNEMLRRRLQEAGEAASRRREAAAATGITDPAVLEKLAGLNVGGDTLAALSLVPLVMVAWADGSIDEAERAAILSAAAGAGLDQRGASYELLNQWLTQRPPAELLATWKAYIEAISGTLDDAARRALKSELLGRARAIAAAAGGILGLGRKVSPAEDAVLKQLEGALR